MGRSVAWLGSVGLVIVVAGSAGADPTSCTLPDGAQMSVVSYFGIGGDISGSPLCNRAGDLLACNLSGWLYTPPGVGPLPALVLSHSAENPRAEGDYCRITEYFLGKGYVVFQPLRRGFRGNAGLGTNTGELPATTLSRLTDGLPVSTPIADDLLWGCENDGVPGLTVFERDCVNMKLQASQALEIGEAVRFLRGWYLVDPDRIALFGHAVGANITAMSAWTEATDVELPGVQAAVLLSPGERSWDDDHPYLKNRLIQSVENRTFPLAFLQPENGESVEPTKDLAHAAVLTQAKRFMATLLPKVEDATPAEVQERFATRATHVARWAPLAWRFIQHHGAGAPIVATENAPGGYFPWNGRKSACDRLEPGTTVSVESYYDAPASANDPLCDSYLGLQSCDLKGVLYVPKNARNAPAIVLNNGGGERIKPETGFCTITEYFNKHGFVVFVPRRRGVIQEEGNDPTQHFQFQNTGKLMADVMDETKAALAAPLFAPIPREAEPYAALCHLWWGSPQPDYDCLSGELLRAEATEVGAAVRWLKGQTTSQGSPLVDPEKVAAMGHSNGGQVVLYAGADLRGVEAPEAIVATSPHEQGWDNNAYKIELLKRAVEKARVPFTIFRPANAPNLNSTRVLGRIAADRRKKFVTEVFLPLDIPEDEDDPDSWVHNYFIHGFDAVIQWAPVARHFMAIFGVKR
jgi:dienelactone hydrolase